VQKVRTTSKICTAILMFTAIGSVAQTASTPHAKVPDSSKVITDPAQIVAKDKFDIQPFTIDKLYMTRTVGDSTWSPDDKQVAFVTNISGRNNIWVVSAQSGWPMQLTVSNQRQTGIAWSPKGRWIAYNSDYDGNEQWDIFLVAAENGQIVNLTNTRRFQKKAPRGPRTARSWPTA